MLSQQEKSTLSRLVNSDPVEWMECNFYISDPRDPETGEQLSPGPIQLAEHQKEIVRLATSRVDGLFQFVTIVYSAVKKSGKTRLAAGVASWYAANYGPYNEIYCIANDGKQSSDRILAAIKQSVKLGRKGKSAMCHWRVTKTRIELADGTFIEAIPCDPSGQAGANPGMTVWSEMWGYRHEHKERLWSEMTVPPTRFGKALRWVESYAGYSDESRVLEDLYDLGVHGSRLHPAFKESGFPVRYNVPAKLMCYWDHQPRMPWQTPEYYAQEASILTTSEFDRIHRNMWVDPVTKAIPIEWWDACEDIALDGVELPVLDERTPIVLALDAAVSHDCCAAVAVSRHPKRKKDVAIRNVRVWTPPKGGKIDLTETMEKHIIRMCERYNVVDMPYDEYQLHKMVTDLRKRGVGRFTQFSQAAPRAVADKQLYEMILHKQIVHGGDSDMRVHVDNAYSKSTGTNMRFVKKERKDRTGLTAKPIDALVAASMATDRCLYLLLGRR